MNPVIIITTIMLFISSINSSLAAEDYPKSPEEREIDEMGSVVGEGGISFRPNKMRSIATKARIGNVNKYLYQAAIEELLNFAPLESANNDTGVVLSNWYKVSSHPDKQRRIKVIIKDDVIATESIEVIVEERIGKKDKWKNPTPDTKKDNIKEANIIAGKILYKARDIYLRSKSDK